MGQVQELPAAGLSILAGTPCSQSGVSVTYFHSMQALHDRCHKLGWHLDVRTREDALVTRTRNTFASQVVREKAYTHLLMIDADIGFEPDVVERLVRSGHHVVGACVPRREVQWAAVHQASSRLPGLMPSELESIAHSHVVTFPRSADGDAGATPDDDFIPARYVGGAMLLARREALVTMAGSDQVKHYLDGGNRREWKRDGWTFFDPLVEPERGVYLSEDFAFCHRWRALGGTVWADLRSAVTHSGNLTVTGDVAATLRTATRLAAAAKLNQD